MKNSREDAYKDKVIKPTDFKRDSEDSDGDDEFVKNVKKRDGIPVGKAENEDMEMKELKGISNKNGKGGGLNRNAATKQESGRFAKFDTDMNSAGHPPPSKKAPETGKNDFEEDQLDQGFSHYGVVQPNLSKGVSEVEKSKEKGFTDGQGIERTTKNKNKEIFLKVIYVMYFPLAIMWKVTLPEFWVKKNFGIHHIIWGYVVSILHVAAIVFLIMSFECNVFHARGWEPSYFGFLMNGVLFSIGFYLYNISIISSSMGSYNYYITVLQ